MDGSKAHPRWPGAVRSKAGRGAQLRSQALTIAAELRSRVPKPPWLRRWVVPRPRGRTRRDLIARVRNQQYAPVSRSFGYERGLPVARFYIEQFISIHKADIRGRSLEVKNDNYLRRFGDHQVTEFHVLDIDEQNEQANLFADLEVVGSLPSGFDCIILTQTIHYIFDMRVALENCYRALAPGGTLLLTAPGVQNSDDGELDYWRFTKRTLPSLVDHVCPDATSEFYTYGSLPTSIAALQGLAVEDLDEIELAHVDDLFPVILAAQIKKPFE